MLSAHLALPASLLEKVPSAGFWSGQTDEADFGMRYEQLDTLLFELEKKRKQNNKKKQQKKKQKKIKLKAKDAEKILKKSNLSFDQYDSICRRLKFAKHKQRMPKMPKI